MNNTHDAQARARVWTLCLAALVLAALTGPLVALLTLLAAPLVGAYVALAVLLISPSCASSGPTRPADGRP